MAILRFSKWRPSAILDLWNSNFLMVGKVKMCWWWWWHGRLDCMCWWWQGSMLQSIERYMKQAIVDKEPSVSSAALTSSLVSQCLVFISFDAVVTAYNTVSVNAWSSFHLTPLSLRTTQCQSMLGRHFIWRRCQCVQHSVSQCLVVISFDAVVTACNTVSVKAWSSFHLTLLSLHATQCQSISRWVQLVSVCLCTSSSVWPVGLRVTWLVTLMVMLLIRGSIYKISYDSLTIILR